MTTEAPEITMHHPTLTWTGRKGDLRAHTIRVAGETLDGSAAPGCCPVEIQ